MKTLFLLSSFFFGVNVIAQEHVIDAMKQTRACEDKLMTLQAELHQLVEDYKLTLHDLQNGLYCSKCSKSKAIIEKTGEPFNEHVKRVNGNIERAPESVFKKAEEDYKRNYEQKQQQTEDQRKTCSDLQLNFAKLNIEFQQKTFTDKQKKLEEEENKKYKEMLLRIEENRKIYEENTKKLAASLEELLKININGKEVNGTSAKQVDDFFGNSKSEEKKDEETSNLKKNLLSDSERETTEEVNDFWRVGGLINEKKANANFTVDYHPNGDNEGIKSGKFVYVDPNGKYSFEAPAWSGNKGMSNNPYSQSFKAGSKIKLKDNSIKPFKGNGGMLPSGTRKIELVDEKQPMTAKEKELISGKDGKQNWGPIFRLVPQNNVELSASKDNKLRDGFLIHSGRNPLTASEGCIILDPKYRQKLKKAISTYGDVYINVQNKVY